MKSRMMIAGVGAAWGKTTYEIQAALRPHAFDDETIVAVIDNLFARLSEMTGGLTIDLDGVGLDATAQKIIKYHERTVTALITRMAIVAAELHLARRSTSRRGSKPSQPTFKAVQDWSHLDQRRRAL